MFNWVNSNFIIKYQNMDFKDSFTVSRISHPFQYKFDVGIRFIFSVNEFCQNIGFSFPFWYSAEYLH